MLDKLTVFLGLAPQSAGTEKSSLPDEAGDFASVFEDVTQEAGSSEIKSDGSLPPSDPEQEATIQPAAPADREVDDEATMLSLAPGDPSEDGQVETGTLLVRTSPKGAEAAATESSQIQGSPAVSRETGPAAETPELPGSQPSGPRKADTSESAETLERAPIDRKPQVKPQPTFAEMAARSTPISAVQSRTLTSGQDPHPKIQVEVLGNGQTKGQGSAADGVDPIAETFGPRGSEHAGRGAKPASAQSDVPTQKSQASLATGEPLAETQTSRGRTTLVASEITQTAQPVAHPKSQPQDGAPVLQTGQPTRPKMDGAVQPDVVAAASKKGVKPLVSVDPGQTDGATPSQSKAATPGPGLPPALEARRVALWNSVSQQTPSVRPEAAASTTAQTKSAAGETALNASSAASLKLSVSGPEQAASAQVQKPAQASSGFAGTVDAQGQARAIVPSVEQRDSPAQWSTTASRTTEAQPGTEAKAALPPISRATSESVEINSEKQTDRAQPQGAEQRAAKGSDSRLAAQTNAQSGAVQTAPSAPFAIPAAIKGSEELTPGQERWLARGAIRKASAEADVSARSSETTPVLQAANTTNAAVSGITPIADRVEQAAVYPGAAQQHSAVAGEEPVVTPSFETGETRSSQAPVQNGMPSPAAPAQRTDAAAVLRQFADGSLRLRDGAVNIRLSPEELGSVQIKLVPTELGLTVHISADRAETLDLLRRNIDHLAQSLAEAGHDAEGFTFSQNSSDGAEGEGEGAQSDKDRSSIAELTEAQETSPDQTTLSNATESGVDIRI